MLHMPAETQITAAAKCTNLRAISPASLFPGAVQEPTAAQRLRVRYLCNGRTTVRYVPCCLPPGWSGILDDPGAWPRFPEGGDR